MRSLPSLSIAAMLAAGTLTGAMAQTVTPTIDYAAGAAPASDKKLSSYGYVTGNGNGSATADEFDVLDYTLPSSTNKSVSTFTINMFDEGYNAADSVGGGISFYVEPDTTTPDGANGSTGTLRFDAASPTGVDVNTTGTGFTAAPILIGSSTVTVPGTTTSNYKYSFTYSVAPGSALATYLSSELATGGTFRVLATPNSTTDPLDLDIYGYSNTAGGNAPSVSLGLTPAAGPRRCRRPPPQSRCLRLSRSHKRDLTRQQAVTLSFRRRG